ncbi:MAG: YARHG domain-containing protein [Eubacteriales bacterium]|nr:YARHG domain-containing protein [Eubacteriales bacterium]
MYIFPDSNRRRLSESKAWEWQYDALGYAFNELFARHGRPFDIGQKYDNYFKTQTWYKADPNYPGDGKVLNNVEWDNYTLIKAVRAQMKAMGTTNPEGKPLPRVHDDRILSPLPGFVETYFKPNQRLKVYDGPGTQYRRGADGKAVASTNGRVYAAGWESGWLMLMYEVNTGGVRVGFASAQDFTDKVDLPALSFSRVIVPLLAATQVTEDPVRALSPVASLAAGTPVTWLNRYYHRDMNWDYIEFTHNGTLMRGFVPDGVVTPFYETDIEITK